MYPAKANGVKPAKISLPSTAVHEPSLFTTILPVTKSYLAVLVNSTV